jgi:hypothetical protein
MKTIEQIKQDRSGSYLPAKLEIFPTKPFPLQIEICGVCNLRCAYCPHPTQERPKGYMTEETFKKSLQLLKWAGVPRIVMHNFGEAFSHPKFFDLLKIASSDPFFTTIHVSTNGKVFASRPYYIQQCKDFGLTSITLSLHDDYFRMPDFVIDECVRVFGEENVNIFGRTEEDNHDWGKSDKGVWISERIGNAANCVFLNLSAYVVAWDGRINVCCIETEYTTPLTVDDLIAAGGEFINPGCTLCKTCMVAPTKIVVDKL